MDITYFRKQLMNPDQQREAKRWFINRFLHGSFAREFALRIHDLAEPISERELRRQQKRHANINFSFVPVSQGLAIKSNQPESDWAEGLIFLDKNNQYQFITGKIVLSTDLTVPDFPAN